MARRKQPQQPLPEPQNSEIEHLLTMGDVEKILKLRRPKVYELMHTHGLPSLKIDGARRFERAKLQAWIEQQGKMS